MNQTAVNLLIYEALNQIAVRRFHISRYEFLTADAQIRCWQILKNNFHDQMYQMGVLSLDQEEKHDKG